MNKELEDMDNEVKFMIATTIQKRHGAYKKVIRALSDAKVNASEATFIALFCGAAPAMDVEGMTAKIYAHAAEQAFLLTRELYARAKAKET